MYMYMQHILWYTSDFLIYFHVFWMERGGVVARSSFQPLYASCVTGAMTRLMIYLVTHSLTLWSVQNLLVTLQPWLPDVDTCTRRLRTGLNCKARVLVHHLHWLCVNPPQHCPYNADSGAAFLCSHHTVYEGRKMANCFSAVRTAEKQILHFRSVNFLTFLLFCYP